MAGRTPHEAVEHFKEPLQLALSCVTNTVINVTRRYPLEECPQAATLGGGDAVALGGASQLTLSVAIQYRIVRPEEPLLGPWKVSTAGYAYELKHEGRIRVIAYHWHPTGISPIKTTHLHLGQGSYIAGINLAGIHLPSGRVSLEEVLRLAIRELGVKGHREDWDEVLTRTQKIFEKYRTWAGSRPPRSLSEYGKKSKHCEKQYY